MTAPLPAERPRVMVVGSGMRFLSGISYYTWHLARAVGERSDVSVMLMRRLLPRRLYPGRSRVDRALTPLRYDAVAPAYDGVDWYWLPSMAGAVRFLRRQRPDVVTFQWWTATVGHSYLLLGWLARRQGAAVVVELHEVLDTGEASVPGVAGYGRAVVRGLLRMASAVVVHSEFDRHEVARHHLIGSLPVVTVPHGPYGHHRGEAPRRQAPADAWNIVFFGTIRPYKGLEHLVSAFDLLPDEVADRCWLTVVGETWEGWDLPLDQLRSSPRAHRTTVVNRYVTDEELGGWLAGADLVVLPYLRSSASGPLHLAMGHGLPTIVTAVGGLVEAAAGYEGAVLVPPADPDAIANAIEKVVAGGDRARRYDDPQSWTTTADRYEELVAQIRRPAP